MMRFKRSVNRVHFSTLRLDRDGFLTVTNWQRLWIF